MIGVTFKGIRVQFFDRDKVIRSMSRARRNVLSKFGAFVRRRAQTSIRKRKDVSKPGMPPSSHQGFYRRSILFAYDERTKSCVVGPTFAKFSGRYPVSELVEKGGTVPGGGRVIFVPTKGPSRTKKFDRVEVTGVMRYRPRPAMQLAFDAEKAGFMALWKDSMT